MIIKESKTVKTVIKNGLVVHQIVKGGKVVYRYQSQTAYLYTNKNIIWADPEDEFDIESNVTWTIN